MATNNFLIPTISRLEQRLLDIRATPIIPTPLSPSARQSYLMTTGYINMQNVSSVKNKPPRIKEEINSLEIDNDKKFSTQEPLPLILPENQLWEVEVTNFLSPTEIWGNIVGNDYSADLHLLNLDMTDYYETNKTPAEQISVGKFYTVYYEGWMHRVRCVSYDSETQQCGVYFIDRGGMGCYSAADLGELDNQFLDIPAQAIRLIVPGFAFFQNKTKMSHLFDTYYYGRIHGKVIKKDVNGIGPSVSIYISHSSKPEDVFIDGVVIDEIQLIIVNCFPLDVPKLYIPAIKVYDLKVCEPGQFYVKVQGKDLDFFEKHFKNFARNNNDELRRVATITLHKTYLVREPTGSNKYYRGKVTEIGWNNVKVFLIDGGEIRTIGRDNLYELDEQLALLPPEIVKVKLHNILSWMVDDDMKNRITKLALPTHALWIKIIDINDVPVIKLFMTSILENRTICVNDAIAPMTKK